MTTKIVKYTYITYKSEKYPLDMIIIIIVWFKIKIDICINKEDMYTTYINKKNEEKIIKIALILAKKKGKIKTFLYNIRKNDIYKSRISKIIMIINNANYNHINEAINKISSMKIILYFNYTYGFNIKISNYG